MRFGDSPSSEPRTAAAHPGRLAVGVDGGGTKTDVVVTDYSSGRVLGRATAGASNLKMVGLEAACHIIADAVLTASSGFRNVRAAGDEGHAFSGSLCVGLAGADTPADIASVASQLKKLRLADRLSVLNDGQLLLRGSGTAAKQWGTVAIVSGTGSVCWGEGPDGSVERAGGWGPWIGDEGSGYWLAVRLLRIAVRTIDGLDRADALLDRVRKHLGVSTASGLMDFVNAPNRGRDEVANLAPLLFEADCAGDTYARSLIDEAARELIRLALAVRARLQLNAPALVLSGSLLVRQESLRKAVIAGLGSRVGAVRIVGDPALVAAEIARELVREP